MLNMKTETDLKKEAEAGLKIRIDFSLIIHSFNQIFRLSFNQIQIHLVRVRRIEYFEIYNGRFRYRRDVKLK